MSEQLNFYEYWLHPTFVVDSATKVERLYEETVKELPELNDPDAVIVWRMVSGEE